MLCGGIGVDDWFEEKERVCATVDVHSLRQRSKPDGRDRMGFGAEHESAATPAAAGAGIEALTVGAEIVQQHEFSAEDCIGSKLMGVVKLRVCRRVTEHFRDKKC